MATNNGFEEFCGGPFWNASLTWDTDHPDFTRCFQQSILVWVPCGFLLVLTPFYIHYLRSLPTTDIFRLSKLSKVKLLISLLLAVLSGADVVKGIIDVIDNGPAILIVSPVILLISFILSGVMIILDRWKEIITSGIQFLFYFLLVIAGIVPFHSYIYQATEVKGEVEDVYRAAVFYTSYALLFVQLVLFCFAEKHPTWKRNEDSDQQNRCPEEEASFLSRITFHWITNLIWRGYKKILKEDDIWLPNQRDVTQSVAPVLEEIWNQEVKRCGWQTNKSGRRASDDAPHPSFRYTRDKNGDEKTVMDNPNGHIQQSPEVQIETKKRHPSFFKALARAYGWTLLKAHLCKLVCDVLIFVGPLLQNALIEFTENDDEVWKGYFYAVLFFVQSVVYSCFFHQLFHIGMTLGMQIKASVISLVYKKALMMSNESRKTTTVGEMVNLMSVDAQRLQDATGYLWMMWSAPLQIAIAVFMLWQLLGVSTMAGVAVMVLLLPLNAVIVAFSRKYQIAQMKLKDNRIKLMNEILNGMKVLKLYAWELSFQEKVTVIRDEELETLKKYSYLSSFATFLWTCAPYLVTLATFATFTLTGGILDASTAFTALSLFNILRFPLNMLPGLTAYLVTASVSVKRIGKFLQNKDIDIGNVQWAPQGTGDSVAIENGTFAWGTTETDSPILSNVNLNVKNGSLTAIVGQVGSGKSSLLSAMLGEMEKLNGNVTVRGSVAYVAQQAWIQNATLRDNILFGKPFDEERYNLILDACSLRPDLQILPAGDQTEIGEKGINLSGGQKQRVSLARAVYQDCDIYLLDDPLSAVDSHVGKHIFERIISSENGLLKQKTRIFVTHGLHWLPKVDDVVVLSNGGISETGSYEELLSQNQAFAQFLKTYLTQGDNEEDEDDDEVLNFKSQIMQKVMTLTADEKVSDEIMETSSSESDLASVSRERKLTLRRSSTLSKDGAGRRMSKQMKKQMSKQESVVEKKPPYSAKDKIIQEEVSATGEVALSVYISYCKSIGLLLSFITLSSFLLYQVASVGSNIWLSEWTEDPDLKNTSISNTSYYKDIQNFYLGIYGAFGAAQALFVLIYALVFALTSVRSSRVLHADMLSNVLRSPMMFFETTPIGRILNRFSRDIETIDNVLPSLIRSWLNTFFAALSTVIIISYSTPIFLAVVVPLFVVYFLVQRFYIPTSRQLKRIESTTRSPIYVNFSETITGSSTIRGFHRQEQFMHLSEKLVDHNLVFYFATISSNRWLGFRLELLGGLIVLAAAIFAVVGRDSISGSIVGLSISYALQVTQALNWMVRMSTDLETNIVSVERVNEYSNTPTEADWHVGRTEPPHAWPSTGEIGFVNYATRYRPGLDLVIKDMTIDIKGGEKIGIVGRTGAGKSSLTLALFRIVEAVTGNITIDGIKIEDLALYPLRSKLVILPQDPVLFSGTLRMNLDPFGKYEDSKIWRALEQAHLKDFVTSLPSELEYECGEGGNNLSVGQRQLVCLARAILRKTKILVLDEATAAVDYQTDELIQKTIRQEFSDCTILTIAHRLNTIMDSDRVMVLDAGVIREFDSPTNLLANKASLFYELANDAGIVKE